METHTLTVKNPINGRDLQWTIPANDTCIGKKLRSGEMWEGKMISEQIYPHARDNTTFIDCGAFIGTHSVCLADARPTLDVVSFEMMPKIYQLLSKNIMDNGLSNVRAWNAPLSNTIGDTRLPCRDYDTPDNYGYTRLDHAKEDGQLVQTMTLDSMTFNKPVSVIKIDVEGHELAVLNGALETIRHHRPLLIVEVWKPNMKRMMDSHFLKVVKGLGYKYTEYYEDLIFTPTPNEISRPILDRNTVFYVGNGKTGSASIYHGFPNRTVCHYHDFGYFNYVTGAKLTSNQQLIDHISNIGYTLGFRPVVIECIREPRSRAISALFHNWYNAGNRIQLLLDKSDDELEQMLESYLKEPPFHTIVKVPSNILYVVLKTDEKSKWGEQLAQYGLEWTSNDSNVNNHPYYLKLKQRLANGNTCSRNKEH